MVNINCPDCGRTIRVPDDYSGKNGRCPGCKAVVDIPESTTEKSRHCPVCNESLLLMNTAFGDMLECAKCGYSVAVEKYEANKNSAPIVKSRVQRGFAGKTGRSLPRKVRKKVKSKPVSKVKKWVFVGVAVLHVVVMLFIAIANHVKVKRISEKTQAQVVSSYVVNVEGSYSPVITVEYEANHETQSSEHWLEPSKGRGWNTDAEARRYLKQSYPNGKQVDLYYNPNNPSESQLANSSGRESPNLFQWLIGFPIVCLLAIGIAWTWIEQFLEHLGGG